MVTLGVPMQWNIGIVPTKFLPFLNLFELSDLKNECFLESLRVAQCGTSKLWDPTPQKIEFLPLSPPF